MVVNGLKSHRYTLYTASVSPIVPLEYSIDLARATPILVPEEDPLVAVTVSKRLICLYAVDSPLTKEISGDPYKFDMLRKFPISYVVTAAFTVLPVLALGKSLKVLAVFLLHDL